MTTVVSFPVAIKRAFAGYVRFSGRATRAEFWWFFLVVVLLVGIPYLMTDGADIREGPWFVLGIVLEVAVFPPFVSVAVRRLHDLDKSGWWFWVYAIPCLGWIWFYILMATPGTRGENDFG
jgi:uncharacterized membrane protein YhaH (DUF805 family)